MAEPGMGLSSIVIRRATLADLGILVGFNQAMAVESEGKTLAPAVIEGGVRNALQDSTRASYFVAETDGHRVVGQTMITFEWSDWRNGCFWWIQSVYVDPAFRRRGVFRALHEHVRKLAKDRRDVCGLRLYVHRDNKGALETYRKAGMTPTDYLLWEDQWS